MGTSRTNNTIRNSKSGLVLKLINILGAFFARTVLIRTLGVEYVGLDGLFTSVLTFLNMTELGFSTAIVYKFYQPIAENNVDRVCALMNFYKKVYRYIGAIVLALGLLVLPFLRFFIKGSPPDNIEVHVLYLIYLANACGSYWLFAYETAVLNAQQRNDIVSKVTSAVLIVKYILQIILMFTFRNYYLYAIILPLSTLLTNIGMHYVTRKYYPQFVCKGNIEKSDIKEIKQKVSALLINKIGTAIITGSDNIVISSFLGLTILGIYDSYYYIFNMLYGIFAVFHSAITASIGNSIVLETKKTNEKLFYKLSFINYWAVGWSSICLLCLYSPFISIWVGKEKVIGDLFSLLMAVYFFFWMSRFIITIYKSAQGLWWEDRYRALIEGGVNLLLNLLAVKLIGIYGITLSTIIAMLIVSIPWETRVLFKKYFEESPIHYFKTISIGTIMLSVIGAITYLISKIVPVEGIFRVIIVGVICIIVPNTIMICVFRNTNEYRWMKYFIRSRITRMIRREK